MIDTRPAGRNFGQQKRRPAGLDRLLSSEQDALEGASIPFRALKKGKDMRFGPSLQAFGNPSPLCHIFIPAIEYIYRPDNALHFMDGPPCALFGMNLPEF
jgi:hypothetical protein